MVRLPPRKPCGRQLHREAGAAAVPGFVSDLAIIHIQQAGCQKQSPMKKRFSLALLFGLLLALLAEAILTLFQALQGGCLRFRWMRRSWIVLPPPAAQIWAQRWGD